MLQGVNWRNYDAMSLLHMTALESLGGVTAFFTGRSGGTSERWGDGLNWSYSTGDARDQVKANRLRALAVAGLPLHRAVIAGLVHGDRVVAVTGEEAPGDDDVRLVPDCDALMTDRPELALVVTAADCVPILLYDPVRRAIAAIHAGWRGTVAGIAARAVRAIGEQYGSLPEQIHAAIGPSIGPCCYEIDDVVADPIRQYYGEGAPQLLQPGRFAGKYMLDLWSANRLDLERSGVTHVTVTSACTSCGVDRLFSHRAEAGKAGRGAAVIALKTER